MDLKTAKMQKKIVRQAYQDRKKNLMPKRLISLELWGLSTTGQLLGNKNNYGKTGGRGSFCLRGVTHTVPPPPSDLPELFLFTIIWPVVYKLHPAKKIRDPRIRFFLFCVGGRVAGYFFLDFCFSLPDPPTPQTIPGDSESLSRDVSATKICKRELIGIKS